MKQSVLLIVFIIPVTFAGQCKVRKEHEIVHEDEKSHGGKGCSASERAKCPEYRQIEYMLLKGCRPVYKKQQCCAEKFECPEDPKFTTELDGKCFCNGKIFNASETVPAETKKGSNCHCFKFTSSCALVRCAFPNITEDSWPTYDLNGCCPKDEVANSDTHPAQCSWKDVNAREGERMQFDTKLPFTCQQCVCDSNFKGPFGPSCKKQECFYQFGHTADIDEGCVPIFEGKSCCGNEFFCPTDKRIEDTKKNYKGKNKKNSCNFGPYSIPVGKKLQLTGDGLKCECLTPPDIICTQKETQASSNAP